MQGPMPPRMFWNFMICDTKVMKTASILENSYYNLCRKSITRVVIVASSMTGKMDLVSNYIED